MLVVWNNRADNKTYVYLIPKMEEPKKETCIQVKKIRYNIVTTDREKVVGKPAKK